MEKKLMLLVLGMMCAFQTGIWGQDAGTDPKTFFSVNPAHSVAVMAVSTVVASETRYLPIHFGITHAFTPHLAVASLLMYRLDKDGEFFLTHEFGFAAGPEYQFKRWNGFFVNFKAGIGYAFGTDYNDSEYHRTDLILQPDLGYYFKFGNRFALACGVGLQSLVKLSESYYGYIWEWNSTGRLSHYYLPVVNISVGLLK
jgi:hypothetical protein